MATRLQDEGIIMLQRDRDWIENHFEGLRTGISDLKVDVATLKVRAGIWGLFGGAIPIIIGIGVYLLTHSV